MTNRRRGIRPPGIRMQLMFWYTGIFALLLLTFSIIFYLALEDALQSDVDADLQLRIQQIAVGITNDNGTTSIEEVLEDVPKLDPAMIGDSFTNGSNQESQVGTGPNANFRSFVRILDVKGKTIYTTRSSEAIPTPSASVTEALHGAVWKGTITIPGGQTMRLYSARLMYKGALFGVIQVGESLAYLNAILHNIVVKLLLIAPFMLLCGAAGSYWLARRAFVPIRNLTCIAEDISAGDLDRRIPVPRPRDEVQHLALTFNSMIGRLNHAFLQQRRFVADASHELRTPVAAIRSMTDVALAQSSTLEESTAVLHDVNTEAERLGWLIQNLLTLARSDEGQVQLDHEFVRLDLLVCDVVATLEALAIERRITLHVEKLEPVTVQGDTSRLIQCVMNLLDNALTYTDAGGKVTIQSEVKENWGCISIIDTGIGIAPEDLPHIFERFYRTDPSRSQIRGGNGLGLSIVDWIIRAHGGSMRVESQLGHGATFTMILPLADSQVAQSGPTMTFSLSTTKSMHVQPSTDIAPHGSSASTPSVLEGQRDSPTPFLEKLYRGLTCPIRILPDFLIIGAQKGGTTSLYNYLQACPCIASAERKEVHFFDRRGNVNKGMAWYRGHFPTWVEKYSAHHFSRQVFLTGEATPEYLFLPHIPYKVAQVLPHVKLIVLLRNPVDRAYSQYQHAVVQGHETRSFEEAINVQEANLVKDQTNILHDEEYERYTYMQHCYLMRSMYIEQLQRWMPLFPRGQFLILKSEEFYTNPATTLKQVLDFLNIPTSETQLRKNDYKPYYANHYVEMDPALRKRLIAFFEPYNALLYDFLGVDFGWN